MKLVLKSEAETLISRFLALNNKFVDYDEVNKLRSSVNWFLFSQPVNKEYHFKLKYIEDRLNYGTHQFLIDSAPAHVIVEDTKQTIEKHWKEYKRRKKFICAHCKGEIRKY